MGDNRQVFSPYKKLTYIESQWHHERKWKKNLKKCSIYRVNIHIIPLCSFFCWRINFISYGSFRAVIFVFILLSRRFVWWIPITIVSTQFHTTIRWDFSIQHPLHTHTPSSIKKNQPLRIHRATKRVTKSPQAIWRVINCSFFSKPWKIALGDFCNSI